MVKHIIVFLSFISTILDSISSQDEFHCWPESERKKLTFTNNNNSIIDHLPTIRFYQGYWASQWALQYVGYLYLKEKMGINVEFFPRLDSGLTIVDTLDLYTYPWNYWDYIENDYYDILLEMWPQPGSNEYYDRGTVIYGGINNIYGEIGFYLPDYVYDEIPDSVVMTELKNNDILRQKFINGYTNNSDRDWVKYFNNSLYNDSKLLSKYLSFGYDLPTYDKPIIWGSAWSYTMSKYAKNMTHKFNVYNESELGIDWIFVPLGTEGLLSEFVYDLYNNKQPFIANIYSPHTDFSTISELTSDYMRFEQISIRRNTDNSRDSTCYKHSQCKEPITPLYKLGNAKLHDNFPEIAAFLFDFNMLAEDLNDILFYHRASGNWLNATCKWLLNNNDKISEWNQDIIRYDCSSLNGCGIFHSINNEYIGGYCANSSIKPLCICTDIALGGKECRTHCPGLIGPNYNISNNKYYFSECSNNGECDHLVFWKCSCSDGYGGDGCEIKYKQFNFKDSNGSSSFSIFIIWLLLFCIIIIIIIISIIWLWKNQRYRSVRLLAARMTTLFSIGLILLCLGTIFYLIQPTNILQYNIICNLRIYCYGIGAILSIMCPLLKAYRVHTIFNQAKRIETTKRIHIPDTKLVLSLINVIIIECIVCIFYSIFFNHSNDNIIEYDNIYYRIEYKCNNNFLINIIWTGNLLYIFFLLLILTWFSFKNRNMKSFIESKCAYFGSIISIFLFFIIIIFYAVTNDTFILLNIQCVTMIFGISIIWFLFYGQQIYLFYKYPKKRKAFSAESVKNKSKTTNSPNNNKNIINSNKTKTKTKISHNSPNSQSIDIDNPINDDDIDDNYEYPYHEKTIKYDNNQIENTRRISLTPTGTIVPFNISNKKNKYKNDLNNLEKAIQMDGQQTKHETIDENIEIQYENDEKP